MLMLETAEALDTGGACQGRSAHVILRTAFVPPSVRSCFKPRKV